MEKQKFHLIFFACLITVFIYSIRLVEFPFSIPEPEALAFEEAMMQHPDKIERRYSTQEASNPNYPDYKQAKPNDVQNVGVNALSYLTGKSKAEIYRLRKKVVGNSIFASSNYEPSEAVFGSIESGKPWIDANPCTEPSTRLQGVNGTSEESRFINNPTMLVAIEYPFQFSNYRSIEWCQDRITHMVPQKIEYSRNKNEIIVTYNYLPFMAPTNTGYFYTFNGLNARDLGYKYAYIDMTKSTYKPIFMNQTNIGNSIIEFQNFIHLGGSCKHEGGCNNGSPRQTYLEFQDDFKEYKYQNREIYIKLWKNRPNSPSAPADITERIILKWS